LTLVQWHVVKNRQTALRLLPLDTPRGLSDKYLPEILESFEL